MLFLLDKPDLLLADAVALLVAIVAHGVVQARVAAALGDRQPLATGRGSLDPRRHFEVFGLIAMLIAGIGWGREMPLQEPRRRDQRSRFALAVLSGPATNAVLAFLGVCAVRLLGGGSGPRYPGDFGGFEESYAVVFAAMFASVNAAIAVLTLIPLPPLDGARLLWQYTPPTEGWRKARYHLEEQNFGLGICLLLVLPIFGGTGLLARIVFAVSEPLLDGFGALIGL